MTLAEQIVATMRENGNTAIKISDPVDVQIDKRNKLFEDRAIKNGGGTDTKPLPEWKPSTPTSSRHSGR